MPRSCETSEVIQTNHIYMTQQTADSFDAPLISRGTKRIPVVDRIAPELSLSAKVVRWDSSDQTRSPLLIEQEKLWMSLNITGIR